MRLESLACKGVLAFDDAVTVDLTALAPGSVVAVTGANGQGKTTLVETPIGATYRTMPFRDKPLVDYALGRESYLEAVWRVDTSTIRTRVNLDGVRRTTEAVVEVDGAAVTDGKVTTFDAEIARRFPPLAVVLASAFAAQNRRGSFVSLDRKGRKELFATLLGLDQFERWAGAARGAVATLEARRAVQQARHDAIAGLAGSDVEVSLRTRADALQVAVGDLEVRRATVTRARAVLAAERPGVVADAERHAQAEAQLAELAADLRANEAERTRLVQARRDLVEGTDREATKLGAGLRDTFARLVRRGRRAEQERDDVQAASAARCEAAKQDRTERIANNRALLAGAETLRAQAAEAGVLEGHLVTLRAARDAADQDVQVKDREARARAQTVQRLSDASGALARAEQDAALLASVPCGGTGPYAACSFLQRASVAAAQLSDLRADLDTYQEAAAQRDDAEQAVLAAQAARTVAARAVTADEQALAALNGATKQIAALDVAEAKIAEHERAIQEAADAHQRAFAETVIRFEQAINLLGGETWEARATYDVALDAARQHAQAEDARIDGALEGLARTHASLDHERDVAATIAADTALAAARLTHLDAEDAVHARAWAETEATRGRLEAEQAALEAAREAFLAHRTDLARLDRTLRALAQDLVEWQALARIFHRDGLPTLLIAAAGPEVAELTNDLASASFGDRFRVELVTQEAKVSGKGLKETFELRVWDGERGGERDLSDLSGGEQVIIDECLKAGLALYAKRHAQMPIETCWRDETCGALDEENRARYVPMLRRLQQLGGFSTLLFVTHDAEIAAQADAQIQVGGGTARLVLASEVTP